MDERELKAQLALSVSCCSEKKTSRLSLIAEFKKIEDLLDMQDNPKIYELGQNEQLQIKSFFEAIVRAEHIKDFMEVKELLEQINEYICRYHAYVENGLPKKFSTRKLIDIQLMYMNLGKDVDTIISKLKEKKEALTRIAEELEEVQDANKKSYEALEMIIIIGEKVLKRKDNGVKTQEALEGSILNLRKRIDELKLSRTIAVQQATHIRRGQSSSKDIAEMVDMLVTKQIPLWYRKTGEKLVAMVPKATEKDRVNFLKDIQALTRIITNSLRDYIEQVYTSALARENELTILQDVERELQEAFKTYI